MVIFQAVQFKSNPYVWSDSAKEVTSPVTQVQLKRTEKDRVDKTVHAHNLSEPVTVVIPLGPVPLSPFNVTLSRIHVANVVFNKTTESSKILIYVEGCKEECLSEVIVNITIYSVNMSGGNIDNVEEFTNLTCHENETAIFNEVLSLG
jgi:hypothetical protein